MKLKFQCPQSFIETKPCSFVLTFDYGCCMRKGQIRCHRDPWAYEVQTKYVLSGPLQSLPFPVLVLSKAGIIGCGGRRGRQSAEIVKTWICWSPLTDKEPHKGLQRESVFILRVHLDGGVKDKPKVMKKI